MQRSAAPGPLTAIIDQHLQELANSGFNSGRRPDVGGIGKPRGLSPSRSGASDTPHSPPTAVRGRGSVTAGGGGGGGVESTRSHSARRSSPSSRVPHDEPLRPPRLRQAADRSPESKFPKSQPGPVGRGTVSGTMKKAQSERNLRDPLTPGTSVSWRNARTSDMEPGSASKDGRERTDDRSFVSSRSRFQPLLKPTSKGRSLENESFLNPECFSSTTERGQWLHATTMERAEWLQVELSELQRRHEELEKHSLKDADALADMVVENDKLKAERNALQKEKAQMEEVFERLKEQRREEKTQTEFQHEREKQELKQEILNLKALVKQCMNRQEEAVKRTNLARKSDKRHADTLVQQLSEVREQHRVAGAQQNEEMRHLKADLARVLTERDLLSAQLRSMPQRQPSGTEDDLPSAISSAWDPIAESGPSRKEVAPETLEPAALQEQQSSSEKQGAQSSEFGVPASVMEMLKHEREAMDRKYAEHFALLMSAVGKQQAPPFSDGRLQPSGSNCSDERTGSGPSSPTVFDIEAPRGCNGESVDDGSLSRGSSTGARVNQKSADMLDQLRRENEEVRRRYGI